MSSIFEFLASDTKINEAIEPRSTNCEVEALNITPERQLVTFYGSKIESHCCTLHNIEKPKFTTDDYSVGSHVKVFIRKSRWLVLDTHTHTAKSTSKTI